MKQNSENKIAIIFNKPGVFPGYEDVVSAHIQLPLQTAKLLQGSSTESIVITTHTPNNQVLPNVFKDVAADSVFFVPDLNKQGGRSAALEGQVGGIKLLKLSIYLMSIIKIIKKNDINVIHVFGTKKFLLLAIIYKIFCPKLKLIWTTENRYKVSSRLIEYIIKKSVRTIIATTEYVQSTLSIHGNVRLVYPGVAREFSIDKAAVKRRVLFWRDPSPENGADIAFKVFKDLAVEFENVVFTFAVRPHWNAVVSRNDCNQFNIEYFETPYEKGITIDRLLSESICVLFPFRELSTNPQLAVIETLNAGIPIICSSVESNREILDKVGLDYELFDDAEDYERRLRFILNDFSEKKVPDNSGVKKLTEYYSWKKYLTACLSVYNE